MAKVLAVPAALDPVRCMSGRRNAELRPSEESIVRPGADGAASRSSCQGWPGQRPGGRLVSMTAVVERLLPLWTQPVSARDDAQAAFAEVYADPVAVNGAAVT